MSVLSNTESALIWVEKAESGSITWSDDADAFTIKCRTLRKRMKPLRIFVKHALLFLALVEIPSWCISESSCFSQDFPRTQLPMLSAEASNYIGLVLWTYVAFSLVLRYYALGNAYHCSRWHLTGAVATALAICDCLKAAISPDHSGLIGRGFRLSRVLRPVIFLCFTKSLRQTAERVIRTIIYVSDVLLALVLCVLFSTWITVLLYSYSAEFKNWGDALASLWILFTTANCPDVFIQTYQVNRYSIFFFLVYIVASLYLLSNILLSSIYDGYKLELKAMLKTFYHNRRLALDKAHTFLAEGADEISKDRWKAFFLLYCGTEESSAAYQFNVTRAEEVFDKLNTDRTSGLSLDEFELIIDVLQDQSGTAYVPRQARPKYYLSQLLEPLLTHGVYVVGGQATYTFKPGELGIIYDDKGFVLQVSPDSQALANNISRGDQIVKVGTQNYSKLAVGNAEKSGADYDVTFKVTWTLISWKAIEDIVIFVDVLLTLVQTVSFVNTGVDNEVALDRESRWFWILCGFSCFYFFEVSLKLIVFGFERFWYSNAMRNRFDFFNVYSMFIATLICTQAWAPTWLFRQVVLQHVLRSFRLLGYLAPLRFIVAFVIRLWPVYYRMGMMLFLVFYVYAMLGMEFFGGQIYKANPRLSGTAFADSDYWTMNFNDFVSSLVLLFVLMVVNNWFIINGGFMKTCDSWLPIIFFVSFFVICNLVVLNILMALILDCSGSLREEFEQKETSTTYNYERLLKKVLMDDDDFKEEEHGRPLLDQHGVPSYGSSGESSPVKDKEKRMAGFAGV